MALPRKYACVLVEQAIGVPTYELAFIRGMGPRVETCGAGLVPGSS